MKDKREQAPEGYTSVEYGKIVYNHLPCSNMTYRESWCLQQYINYINTNLKSYYLINTKE